MNRQIRADMITTLRMYLPTLFFFHSSLMSLSMIFHLPGQLQEVVLQRFRFLSNAHNFNIIQSQYFRQLLGRRCMVIYALCYLGIANDPDTGVPDAVPGNSAISSSIELFTSMAFLVFTSVMLSTYIVSAYKNKTMNLMFSYPIKRQKILISQMLAVWIFNFVALVLTKLLIYGCIFISF